MESELRAPAASNHPPGRWSTNFPSLPHPATFQPIMSSATLLKSVTFRPNVNIQTRRTSQPKRISRTRLGIHAVTNWQLEPKKPGNKKGEFVDLTESIADKATASVKSSGGDFVGSFLGLEFMKPSLQGTNSFPGGSREYLKVYNCVVTSRLA